jgi:hypothetical protein
MLYIEYGPGVTATEPIIGRKYTEMRDEVLAEWQTDEGNPFLYAYVYVGQFGPAMTAIRILSSDVNCLWLWKR